MRRRLFLCGGVGDGARFKGSDALPSTEDLRGDGNGEDLRGDEKGDPFNHCLTIV